MLFVGLCCFSVGICCHMHASAPESTHGCMCVCVCAFVRADACLWDNHLFGVAVLRQHRMNGCARIATIEFARGGEANDVPCMGMGMGEHGSQLGATRPHLHIYVAPSTCGLGLPSKSDDHGDGVQRPSGECTTCAFGQVAFCCHANECSCGGQAASAPKSQGCRTAPWSAEKGSIDMQVPQTLLEQHAQHDARSEKRDKRTNEPRHKGWPCHTPSGSSLLIAMRNATRESQIFARRVSLWHTCL